MELFQDIPQVIQADILCNWLKQQEVAHLDSALCSKIIRPLFFSALGNQCVFSTLDTTYEDHTQWIIARNIKVKSVVLRHDTEAAIREKLFKCSSGSLREVSLCTDDFYDDDEEENFLPVDIDETFFDIAMLCPMIQELSAWHVKATSNLNLVMLKCVHLTSLHLAKCTDITNTTIKSICSAPKLITLELADSQFETDTPNFSSYKSSSVRELYAGDAKLSSAGKISLCACFQDITALSVGPVSGDDLIAIAVQCSLVKDANIRIQGTLVNDTAALLCKQWPNIELLQLESEVATRPVCSEETVLVLLKGCRNLLKLCVCALDYPHRTDHLYYSKNTNSASVAPTAHAPAAFSSATTKISTTANSKVTDLFLESASEATLRAILSLCPQLNTLAIRHGLMSKPPRDVATTHLRAAEYALVCLNQPSCSVRKLHLHNIRSLAGMDLLSLTSLEELHLSNIGKNVRNEAILKIVQNNPNLRSISLYNCVFLRSTTLILPLLKLYPMLHTFNFTECDTLRNSNSDKAHSFSAAILILQDVIRDSYPNIKTLNLVL